MVPGLKNDVLYDFDAFFFTLFQEIWNFQIFDGWVGGDTKSEKNQKSQKSSRNDLNYHRKQYKYI